MRLRKECEHGRWEEHSYMAKTPYADLPDSVRCPGGEFLSEGALVIEKVDGEWKLSPRGWHVLNAASAFGVPEGPIALLNDFADALASQVGESE